MNKEITFWKMGSREIVATNTGIEVRYWPDKEDYTIITSISYEQIRKAQQALMNQEQLIYKDVANAK